MAPRYIPAHGKSVGLPNTWPSSPTHRGQNMVHAEADWIGRMEKEEKQAKKSDPAGAFADGAEIVIPQYQPDSPVRDKWGWGKSALVADGAILNPMTAYRTSTQCGRPASVVAADEQRLREKTPRALAALLICCERERAQVRPGPRHTFPRWQVFMAWHSPFSHMTAAVDRPRAAGIRARQRRRRAARARWRLCAGAAVDAARADR